MTETPGYFQARDGVPLYGVYHAPDTAARVPLVIAPSFFEERKSAYGALCALARACAAAGHPVLRFDYRGSGESGGAPALRRWSELAADLAAAVERLKALSGSANVAVAGLRLGGTLILQQARSLRPAAVVALAPFAQGRTQERQWRLRAKMRAEITSGTDAPAPVSAAASDVVDLDGFATARAFLDDVQAVDLFSPSGGVNGQPAGPLPCPTLLLQITLRDGPQPDSQRLIQALGPQTRLECLRLEAFWDRIDDVEIRPMVNATVQFLGTVGGA